ncbi:CatB-related O-acetyltransferase [uncultured Selenomonas sp.]|uniref:CatB-related O-acetyltransferase n=1 Tax=uncultured Selenomonas sp. TaxID=159275 RepID=UPI0025EA9FD1|nr:CatB-related O-acetyltransferase [uncultured Selenomonas sp.]
MSAPRIVFFHDDFYPQLKPFYEAAVRRGDVVLAGSLVVEDGRIVCRDAAGEYQDGLVCDYVAAGAQKRYLSYKKPLRSCGVPEERIIDGCVFAVPGIDLAKFFADGSIRGTLKSGARIPYHTITILPVVQTSASSLFVLRLGRLSYIGSCDLEGRGYVTVGNFSSISWNQCFELGLDNGHHLERVSSYDWMGDADWPEFQVPPDPLPVGRITIGSDVWIGRGCRLKSSGHPLVIGDGAVVASDSNVVKDVPPYAIVGGNPAKFIRWRFPEPIREGLQKIRWWDWPLEKIHAARLEMKDPAAFVEKYLLESR